MQQDHVGFESLSLSLCVGTQPGSVTSASSCGDSPSNPAVAVRARRHSAGGAEYSGGRGGARGSAGRAPAARVGPGGERAMRRRCLAGGR
jgi:hypothetical protein